MAILVECPKCHYRIPVSSTRCSKCDKPLPKNQQRIYWIDVRLPNRKRKRSRLGLVTLAEAEIANIEAKRCDGHQSEVYLWKDIRRRFERYLESEHRGTQYKKDSLLYLKRMADFWSDTIPISSITRQRVMEFRTTLREAGLAESTCNRYIAAGKAAIRVFDPDMTNPFSIRFYNENEKIGNSTMFLSNEQRERLLVVSHMVSQHLYEIVFVALFTGWRKSEILSLRRDMIDWKNKVGTVEQKRGRLIHRPISQKVFNLLLSVEDNGTPYFWISAKTGKPYTRDWKTPWQTALKQAGISPSFRFHDLRHDFAIRAYGVTGSQRTVQDLLGHHQLSTTQRYVKILPEHLRNALDSM